VADQLAELEANAGTQFDANVVRHFVAAYREHGDPRAGKWAAAEEERS
jgi:HD-GYP domain-containing protein (c-di-GMP phosphodiesterase class II)